MNKSQTALEKVRRARFEAKVVEIMENRNPRERAMMIHFASQSDAFVELRDGVLDRYFYEQRQLSPLFCVDAMVKLVQQVIDTMQAGLQQQAA